VSSCCSLILALHPITPIATEFGSCSLLGMMLQVRYRELKTKDADDLSYRTGAGVWGVGGVAAADDGTVFALTGNAVGLGTEQNP
jgi:hypothetical protein